MMKRIQDQIQAFPNQSQGNEEAIFCEEDYSIDDHSSSILESTNWNSLPIYDEYLDEDCELFIGRQIVEDDD